MRSHEIWVLDEVITVTTKCAWWLLKSTASRLFTQPSIRRTTHWEDNYLQGLKCRIIPIISIKMPVESWRVVHLQRSWLLFISSLLSPLTCTVIELICLQTLLIVLGRPFVLQANRRQDVSSSTTDLMINLFDVHSILNTNIWRVSSISIIHEN